MLLFSWVLSSPRSLDPVFRRGREGSWRDEVREVLPPSRSRTRLRASLVSAEIFRPSGGRSLETVSCSAFQFSGSDSIDPEGSARFPRRGVPVGDRVSSPTEFRRQAKVLGRGQSPCGVPHIQNVVGASFRTQAALMRVEAGKGGVDKVDLPGLSAPPRVDSVLARSAGAHRWAAFEPTLAGGLGRGRSLPVCSADCKASTTMTLRPAEIRRCGPRARCPASRARRAADDPGR